MYYPKPTKRILIVHPKNIESGALFGASRGFGVWTINGNYLVITLIFKNCNLPLFLNPYALFSLPPIFTKNIFTYTLSYTIYLGEPWGNIISNHHGIFIHIFMHGYDPSFKIYILTVCFGQYCRFICQCIFSLANFTSKTISFFTSWIFLLSWYR